MKMSDITSIGRSLDPDYPTNRAIVIVTILVTVGGALYQRLSAGGWVESLLWGVNAGLSVFLAWVVCRELDPDHPVGAFVAAALALVAVLIWDLPELGVILWLVIVMRVVNRTTGLPAGVLDALGLVGLGGWLSLQAGWGYGAVTALALLLDGLLPDRARRQLVFALLAVLVTVAVAVVGDAPVWPSALSLTGGLIALGLSLLFVPVILASRSLESVCDQTEEPVKPVRVQAAQALALLAGVGAAFLGGVGAMADLSPLWAAILAGSITWLYNTLRS